MTLVFEMLFVFFLLISTGGRESLMSRVSLLGREMARERLKVTV